MSETLIQLAQAGTSAPKDNPAPTIVWASLAGIACLVVGGMILLHLRKRMLDRESAANAAGSLMEHLREAHRRGEISDAEYEQTRKSMAARVSAILDTKRSGGLFELPDPKRRVGGGGAARSPGMGPIAPPAAPDPAIPGPSDLPPGYGPPGSSANPAEPRP